MSETFNPFSDAYAAAHLADEARSLSSTLLLAPAQEPRRLTALRHWLSQIADALAEKCAEPADDDQIKRYKGLMIDLREFANDINATNHIVPSGMEIVLKAFQEQLHPGGIIILPPEPYLKRKAETIGWLMSGVEECGLSVPLGDAVPSSAFVLQYPLGEQDNVMNAPLQLATLYLKLTRGVLQPKSATSGGYDYSREIALRALGPAYLFAYYAQRQNWRAASPLSAIQHLLKEQGWLDHPTLGRLLERISSEVSKETRDDIVDTPEWKALCDKIPAYTPEQFDAEVPILWERLKQLLPPNELGMDEVESENPASLVSILNAGWSFYLLHMEDLYKILGSKTAQDKYDAKMVLNRLLTKGVELSQITQNWRTARKAIGQ
ncbi:MAG: hypothetical protein NT023_00690 [Armatimonadetes bacterium]|nr:hypothetical protein [Armatimonadota bacterium]